MRQWFSADQLFGEGSGILRDSNFQIMLLAAVLPILGVALVSPVIESLIDPFGTTPADIGLLISFYTAPAIVMIPVAGVMADRFGRKVVLIGSLVLFGLAGTAIAFTTDFRVILALRLLQGIGFGGINPTLITSVGDLFAGTEEATGQGLRFTVSGLSGTVFPFIAGVVVLFGWQYPFLLYALTFPIAALVYLNFQEPTSAPEAAPDGAPTTYFRDLLGLIRHPRVLAFLFARSLPPIVWLGFFTYNSLIVVRIHGGTPPQAGLLVAVGSFVFGVTASQAGRLTARYRHLLYPLLAGHLCMAGGFVIVLFAPVYAGAVVGVVVTGVGFGILMSLYRSIITGLASESLRAGLVSVGEAGGRVTGTLTPIVMGGFIAVAGPVVGVVDAIKLAGLGGSLVVAVGGVVCLWAARSAPPVPVEEAPT